MGLPLPNGPCRKVLVTSIHFQNGIFCVYLGANSHLGLKVPKKKQPTHQTPRASPRSPQRKRPRCPHLRGIAIGFALATRRDSGWWQVMGPQDGPKNLSVVITWGVV